MALKDGVLQAKPVLLEPIMTVEVHIPEQYMGEVNRDLNGRRGRVLGHGHRRRACRSSSAHVPQSELFSYATELRSLTGGRGTFSAMLDHYEDVPSHLADKIVEAHKKEHVPSALTPRGSAPPAQRDVDGPRRRGPARAGRCLPS